jgi:hypothetical protein
MRRAGDVTDHTTWPRGVNGGIEQLPLDRSQRSKVLRSATPSRFGSAPQGPETGTRHVNQYAIKELITPRTIRGITGDHVRFRTVQGMSHEICSMAMLLDSSKSGSTLQRNPFKDRRLAPWASAHIEPGNLRTFNLCPRERKGHQLTAFVLHSENSRAHVKKVAWGALDKYSGQR